MAIQKSTRKSSTVVPELRPLGKTATGKPKLVLFNPGLATELWKTESFTSVLDSLGFWYGRLRAIACPDCGVIGALRLIETPAGCNIECSRIAVDRCDFVQEIMLWGQMSP